MIVSGFRAALDLGTYPLSNLIRPRCAEQAKTWSRLASADYAYWLFRLFSRHNLSNAVVSAKSPRYFSYPCSTEAVGIVHKPPRSAKRVVDKHTNRQTDTQTKFCNTRCACVPRVNKNYNIHWENIIKFVHEFV